MDQQLLESVRERFKNDRFATENGAIIEEFGEGYSIIRLPLDGHHYNAVGSVMGGTIFTIADFAFAVAANWKNERPCVSQTATITYLGRAKGKELIAEARCKKDGRSVAYYEIEVKDDLGNQVAHVTSSGFKVG